MNVIKVLSHDFCNPKLTEPYTNIETLQTSDPRENNAL